MATPNGSKTQKTLNHEIVTAEGKFRVTGHLITGELVNGKLITISAGWVEGAMTWELLEGWKVLASGIAADLLAAIGAAARAA